MRDHDRELANRLFAVATAMLEDAIEHATAGQSPRLSPARLAECGRRLQAATREIAMIAEATEVVAGSGATRRRNRRKSAP